MTVPIVTRARLQRDLRRLGVTPGDGLVVHASMRAIGPVIGDARSVVDALLSAVGASGLVAMPAFSTDAYFPARIDPASLALTELIEIERAVPGFHKALSPSSGMGVIAETFRTWPGTARSDHPAVSVCLNGASADAFARDHALAWATGPKTPLGKLRDRAGMKILLIGVGWNRCSALHTADTSARNG